MSSEPEAPDEPKDTKPEKDDKADRAERAMDDELKAIGAALRAIKPLGPAARAYVLERLKTP